MICTRSFLKDFHFWAACHVIFVFDFPLCIADRSCGCIQVFLGRMIHTWRLLRESSFIREGRIDPVICFVIFIDQERA